MAKTIAKKEEKVTALAVMNFAEDAGMGMEGADKDSFAIPFLTVLQGLSPQCEEVDGAKPGLLINTVTNELAKEARVIPVAFKRRYLRWVPRNAGGGFKGEMSVAEVEALLASGDAERAEEGSHYVYEGDELKDTRMHYVLVEDANGAWQPAMMSLGSTQIKKSKRWMSQINGIKLNGPNGMYTPPSFSHIYKVGTVKESNDQGSWYGYTTEVDCVIEDASVYNMAKAFHKQVSEGVVTVDHEAAAGVERGEDSENF